MGRAKSVSELLATKIETFPFGMNGMTLSASLNGKVSG